MPSCRRKRVMLRELTSSLLEDVEKNPDRPVFYMEQTGEIFPDYDSYAARLSFYRIKQFQCEVTGKSGLDYFQALESEQQEARTLHARFPQPLKAPVLRAVQWQVVGRLDHLVEAVFDRFKDRYFEGERVYVDIGTDRYWSRILKVYPPNRGASIAASGSTSPPPEEAIHPISGDLKVPAAEVNAADDPKSYTYRVQLTEEGTGVDIDINDPKGKARLNGKFDSSAMDVKCDVMSRDRLSFSKSILRRFIRDCVDRDAAVASPWTVKKAIAEKYGVENVMPEETRKGVEEVKNKEIEKRKKVWEDKELPPSKKAKKMEEKAAAAKAKEEELQRAKEEAPQPPPEPQKKKYIKYPTEDLDVVLSQREKTKRMAANGHLRSVRPKPHRDLPFPPKVFESLLMVWSFFMSFGVPLKLSPFTLDEFEAAIRHNDPDQPVTLISEIHSSLIYALRALSTHRHSAVVSLLALPDTMDGDGLMIETLVDRMAEFGNNWERQPLRVEEGRAGWEEALIGVIKDQATTETFRSLRAVMTSLLFTHEKPQEDADEREVVHETMWTAHPAERYYRLSPEHKLDMLSFLCDSVASHKEIHTYMEGCEANLTLLRKERIEIKKERKRLQDEMASLEKEDTPNVNGSSTPKGKNSKAPKVSKETQDSKDSEGSKDGDEGDRDEDIESELSEPEIDPLADSDDGSDTETASNPEKERVSSRQKGLRLKAQTQAHAKQREIARAKNASAKQAQAEHRRLDEEDNKLERRMEAIEREFRKWSGVIRLKPLGKDRFYNRYFWFDGVGSSPLIATSGNVAYGSGRLFVQGPTALDYELMVRKEAQDPTFKLQARREDEEGADGILGVGEWGYYSEAEQFNELMNWLNPKGNRELKLKENLTKWAEHITAGMRRRLADLNASVKVPEARRSTRKNAPEARAEPYLLWQNKKAPIAPS